MMKRVIAAVVILAFALCMAGCGASDQTEESNTDQTAAATETQGETMEMKLLIGEEEVTVDWENNDAVAALQESVGEEPLTIDMSMYDDFEQVGDLGMSLPADDEQIKTSCSIPAIRSSCSTGLTHGIILAWAR